MATVSQKGFRKREVIGSAKRALVKIHVTPLDAYREVTSNAMTYMHVAGVPEKERITEIIINVGNHHDSIIQAPGTGILDYDKFIVMGHDMSDPEYQRNLADPDFLSQIGIGINSLVYLSEDGIVEFHSVSKDAKGRPVGLVAIMRYDDKVGEPEFEDPPERWLLQDPKSMLPYDGLKVVVKRAKNYPTSKIAKYLSEEFARKLNQGYQIHLTDNLTGKMTNIKPPEDFCSGHETTIGHLSNGYPVRADLHSIDKQEDYKVKVLVKKMPMDMYDCDYLCKGYVMCDCLEFTPNRKGVMKETSLYAEMDDLIRKHCITRGFALKSKSNVTDVKNKKKWIEKATELLMKYRKQHPNQEALNLKAFREKSQMHGTPTEDVIDDGWENEEERKENEQEEKIQTTGKPKRKYKKYNQGQKKYRITDDDQESIPDLECALLSVGMDRPMIFLDIDNSTIVINLSHPWAEHLAKENDDLMHAMMCHAVIEAQPENKYILREEFMKQYWELLNA